MTLSQNQKIKKVMVEVEDRCYRGREGRREGKRKEGKELRT
jgi:hypothetical protein